MTDTGSTFQMNSANLGGNVYCDGCTVIFSGTIFKDSLAYEGSVLYLINAGSATFTNVNM